MPNTVRRRNDGLSPIVASASAPDLPGFWINASTSFALTASCNVMSVGSRPLPLSVSAALPLPPGSVVMVVTWPMALPNSSSTAEPLEPGAQSVVTFKRVTGGAFVSRRDWRARKRFTMQSEKLLDVTVVNGKVTKAGNQFGVGAKK